MVCETDAKTAQFTFYPALPVHALHAKMTVQLKQLQAFASPAPDRGHTAATGTAEKTKYLKARFSEHALKQNFPIEAQNFWNMSAQEEEHAN